MSTYSTAARNAARDAISALLVAGSGTYPTMKIRDAAQVTLVSVNLNATTPIGAASNGVATVAPPFGEATWVGYVVTPVANGTAADCVFCDKDGTVVETGTVGTSGAEVILSSLTIQTTVAIAFTAAPTLTQLAS